MATGGETALVMTKLSPPVLPGRVVTRSRLDDVLEDAVNDPVIRLALVSAPAGSGKSTLVATWQQARPNAAWLQVDAADGDAARFWAHVVASLERVRPIGPEIHGHIARAADDPNPLIDRLANVLADGDEIVLVIDDYHLVANPAIDDAVERLVELAPAQFTVVIVTRWDPAIRISRLRVAGRLAEIRAHDLRFLQDEAADLLNAPAAGHSIRADDVRALCDRTEGWAAGLVLARLSLDSAGDEAAFVEAFRGDDRLVVDYLSDEFFAQLSDAEVQRLVATSILEEMSGPLVDAVCETTDGTTWLAELTTRNQLVIGLGQSREWYRYHHLLRDVLRMKAETEDQTDDLHRRAAAWHREHGDLDRAAEHLLAAGDLADAAGVIADHSFDLINLGQLDTVSGYLTRLGPAVVGGHLRCSLIEGWIHAVRGRAGEATRALEHLRVLESTSPDDPMASGLIAGLEVLLLLGNGDVGAAIAAASTAPPTTDATQTLVLAQAFVWGGRFEDADIRLGLADRLAHENGDQFAITSTPPMCAVAALERDDRSAAQRFAHEGIAVIDRFGAPQESAGAVAYAVLARTSDDPALAVEHARVSGTLAAGSVQPLSAAYALASAGDVLCTHGIADAGTELVGAARSIVARTADPGIVGRYVARVEARHRLTEPAPTSSGRVDDLTERELAVLRYLPSAMSQRDIASELFVSLNTVKTHCRAIYRKLGATDRKAAVQAARDAGLL